MELLLYSLTYSARLQYTCHFIFTELMGTEFSITTDVQTFKNYDGIKINYSNSRISDNELYVSAVDLLFENNIRSQTIECFEVNNNKAFFKTPDSGFPFDIFAASFYLLSRYEEYLPHQKDIYGRYAHENSLAFKEGFLQLPLINIWIKDFSAEINKKFPLFTIHHSPFTFIPTYDIDIAYSYKHKGLIRNTGGFFRSPSLERIRVLCGLQKDPFDVYDWLNALHEKFQLHPIYFFLVAAQNGIYDKNISPATNAMRQLIKRHAKKYTIGIHPSWQSGDNDALLKKEIGQLQVMAEKAITVSRQHYIRFTLPEGYRRILDAGITEDYSMGYGSINGFRASVASSFNWYDLVQEKETSLRIHPFCFMEANSFYEQKLTATEAFEELMHYYTICKNVNGTFIIIWHNHLMGSDKLYTGWGNMYEKFLQTIG
jgi:hypothetical protein